MIYNTSSETDTEPFKSFIKKREKIFNVKNYINDGFEKVCDVLCTKDKFWWYVNINKELMYSEHNSWVYFIVIDDSIVKCGETGNPLGIRSRDTTFQREIQPIADTSCRFGRLRRKDGTDRYIRESTIPYIINGHKISLWAKKCSKQNKKVIIAGKEEKVETAIHKDLELKYLNYFKIEAGMLPLFNKATK